MAKFSYRARNHKGRVVTGEVSADNKARAKNLLVNKNLRPIKVTPLKSSRSSGDSNAASRKGLQKYIFRDANGSIQIQLGDSLPTTKELALFTKQFSLMIENGIPMLQTLQLLKEQQKKQTFSEVINNAAEVIEQGASLSDAFEQYPNIFDQLYVAMTRAGEASGKLDVILRQLVKYIEKSAKLKSQVKSAMAYPTIIVVVSIIVIVVLLVFVVPSFAQQFSDSGNELPAVTQFVMDASDAIVAYWHFGLAGALGGFFAFKYWHGTDNGRRTFDTYILKAPLIGDVMSKIAIGRFASTMSTMMASGVSILDALDICAASSGNKKIEEFVLHVKDQISKGDNFSDPLAETDLFPKMVSSMVAVGEQTGTLDETLAKVTEIYEDEVDTAIAAMMSMIEPIMIVVIGGLVGFILIAMYLPIFDMANNIGG